jgi:uncharacterized membrane protein YphA (DoxX/SURF4 family)
MQGLYSIGRLALVALFLYSGVMKFLNIAGTAQYIQGKMTFLPQLTELMQPVENATGMTTPTLLAILAGVLEIAGALMILLNVGARVGAFILFIFLVVTTVFFHDFWNMTGADYTNNLNHALKNLSIMGAMLIVMALAGWRPVPRANPYD